MYANTPHKARWENPREKLLFNILRSKVSLQNLYKNQFQNIEVIVLAYESRKLFAQNSQFGENIYKNILTVLVECGKIVYS